MIKAVLLLCALSLALAASIGSQTAPSHDDMTFEQYIVRFGKSYPADELSYRRAIFESRVAKIQTHNANTRTHVKTINKFTDWTESEFKSLLGFDHSLHHHRALGRQAKSQFRDIPARPRLSRGTLPIPDSVDWAASNATTPVKNQGGCGSCWAFAGTSAIESDLYLETGHMLELSPQLYVDCVSNADACGGSGGCQGSVPDLLFEFARTQGARNESSYPYSEKEGVCLGGRTVPVASITGWVDVISNDVTALMLAVAKQPVTIGVAANQWAEYSGGVLSFDECESDINHAVIVVGYGTDPELGDYWKVQNSWGPDWGEHGFIRLARSSNDSNNCKVDKSPKDGLACRDGPAQVTVCGTCGILYAASYPVGAHLL